MFFSQRIGIEKIKTEIQIENMDLGLRNNLWDIISEKIFKITK